MFEFLHKRTPDIAEAKLTEEQAREIVEAEIARRGWKKLTNERYRVKRQHGRYLWCYQSSRMSRPNMQVMGIEIDATTGDVVRGSLNPEKAWGPR